VDAASPGDRGRTHRRAALHHRTAARRYEGGTDHILYGNDCFQLDKGEAPVVECDAPDATPTAACDRRRGAR
jgi:hypothetical protein